MKNQFKYDSQEFFYDKSFTDYPLTELYNIVDNFIAYNSISWTPLKQDKYHKMFNGAELKTLAPYLLEATEFAQLSLKNFSDINTGLEAGREIRVVNFQKGVERLKLHPGLQIVSFTIQSEIADAKFYPTLKTFNIFMTASFETIPDLFL